MRLINTYDQLKAAVEAGIITQKQAISISYAAYSGRGSSGSRWQVWSPYFKTDPEGHWTDYGKKSFPVYKNNRKEILEEVKKWVADNYGITDWKFNRAREYVPSIVNEKLPIPKRESE